VVVVHAMPEKVMEDVDLLGLLDLEDFKIIDLRRAEEGRSW
jgi:hypothetical protein